MADGIAQWLEGLGLSQYAQVFEDNAVGFEALPHLTEDDLKELGLALGHRRILQGAIKGRAEEPLPTTVTTRSPSNQTSATPAEAERRQLTVLFCDLVGSTALSAKLDPEDMREVLRDYQEACASVIDRYEGYVAKFMGDGVYAYFGYPTAHEDDAERAINAGLGIVEAVAGIKQNLAVRIGVATGTVAVGDLIGKGASEEANVVGEAPNLAARLQAIAQPNMVVTGEATYRLAGNLFETKDFGEHSLSGFDRPVHAWVIVGQRQSESRFEATRGERLTELVGREEELGTLVRRWQRAKEGEGQLVLISGEPGIGKSRLVHSFRETVKNDSAYFRVIQCSPHHTNSALFPFLEPTLSAIGISSSQSDDEKLDRLEAWIRVAGQDPKDFASIYGAYLNIDTTSRYPLVEHTPQRQKTMLFDAFAERLMRLSASHGFVFVVEDAHWIDPTSLELLSMHIGQAQKHPKAMVIVTYRPEFDAPWVGQANTILLALSRLSRRQCATLAKKISGLTDLPTEVIEQISERTDGIPLFVEELTKAVLETTLRDQGSKVVDIPATLQDSLEARLDRLGTGREVAQLGAVIGREFDHKLIAAVSPLSENALTDGLGQLVHAGLIVAHGIPPEARYAFKHSLVQETAYNSLLRPSRRELHHRVVEVLEKQFPEIVTVEPEIIAHHYTEAGLKEQAIKYWKRAGESAKGRSGLAEAARNYFSALDLLLTLPQSKERDEEELELQLRILPVAGPLFGPHSPEMDRTVTRAHELCLELDNVDGMHQVLFGRYAYYIVGCEPLKALGYAEELLALAEKQNSREMQAVAHRMIGTVLFRTGELSGAQISLEKAVELYSTEDNKHLRDHYLHDAKSSALVILSAVHWLLGKPEQALTCLNSAMSHVETLHHPTSTAYALGHGCVSFRALARDLANVLQYASQLREFADEHKMRYYNRISRFHIAWAQFNETCGGDDINAMTEALGGPRDMPVLAYWPWHATLLADALHRVGRSDEALDLLDQAQTISNDDEESWCEPEIHRIRGDVRASQGFIDEAEADYQLAIELALKEKAKSLELRAAIGLARLWQTQDRNADGRSVLAPIYSRFTEGFNTADLKDAKALLQQLS